MTTTGSWRDGAGGSIALLADLFSDEELAPLARRFPVVERFVPHGEGFVSTRWPGSIDAALATLAARALRPTHPELADVMRDVRACDKDATLLGELFARTHEAMIERASAAPPDAVMTSSLWAPRAFVLAHLGASRGISAYDVHRRYVPPSSEASAQLLRLAITEHGLEQATVVGALAEWAPTGHHSSQSHSTADRSVRAATWPDLAIVVDGSLPEGFFGTVAAECAASRALSGAAIVAQVLERLTQELSDAHGLGVALMTDSGAFGATFGTVRCYPHPDPRPHANDLPATHFATEFTTLVLSTLPLAPDDESSRPDPIEVHEAFTRLPLRSLVAKMVRSVSTQELGAPPVAVSALRAGWAPAPVLSHDPVEVSHRRERLLEIAERLALGFGLSVVVRSSAGLTNALFESAPCLQVVVVRDDIEGAADETEAARRLQALLAREHSLRPFTVHGEYCK